MSDNHFLKPLLPRPLLPKPQTQSSSGNETEMQWDGQYHDANWSNTYNGQSMDEPMHPSQANYGYYNYSQYAADPAHSASQYSAQENVDSVPQPYYFHHGPPQEQLVETNEFDGPIKTNQFYDPPPQERRRRRGRPPKLKSPEQLDAQTQLQHEQYYSWSRQNRLDQNGGAAFNVGASQYATKQLAKSTIEFEHESRQRRFGSREASDDSEDEYEDDGYEHEQDEFDSEDGGDSEDDDDDELFTSARLQESVLAPLGDRRPDLGLPFNVPGFGPRAGPKRRKQRGAPKGSAGPRKAAEPTGDIKLRLSKANEAFMEEDYQTAINVISEVIRINAETYEAWTMLASAWQELGDVKKANQAYLGAAQLRPKHADSWLSVALKFEDVHDYKGAEHCYRVCARLIPNCIDAYYGKARMNIQKCNYKGAVIEYQKVIKQKPHDLDVIRGLAGAYEGVTAHAELKELLKDAFAYFRQPANYQDDMPDWNDLVTYISSYIALGEYEDGVRELKYQARWLVGRESETIFEDVTINDCEWDMDGERRAKISGFVEDKFDISSYGSSLPIHLRIQLGVCRFGMGNREEALRHFEWLDPSNKTGTGKVLAYTEFYYEIADLLFEAGLFQRALTFYGPLKKIPEEQTVFLYMKMAQCFRGSKIMFKAEQFYLKVLEMEEFNIEARIELGEMCLEMEREDDAYRFVIEATMIKNGPPKPPRIRRRGRIKPLDASESAGVEAMFTQTSDGQAFRGRLTNRAKRKWLQEDGARNEKALAKEADAYYSTFLNERKGVSHGDRQSISKWIKAVQTLTDEFRSVRNFYPYKKAADSNIDGTAYPATLAYSMQNNLPSDFRGIDFKSWLDIFLEYALYLAKIGDRDESYELCEAARDSTVFSRSREDIFLIHIVWCACALYAADEQACYFVSKSFMKEYAFTTDAYRMFAAVSKMCHSPLSWYMGGPIKKYVRRQILAMDQEVKKKPNGKLNDDALDISLMMLYAHIMYTSESYDLALEYMFRCHALDEHNPMVCLSISLTFFHLILNRRIEDQARYLLQGMTFLLKYYDSRKYSLNVEERQEAHYNVARAYHMLGLTGQALPYYILVLEETETAEGLGVELRQELVVDAAYNLQTIYSTVGNLELTKAVTERWLVL